MEQAADKETCSMEYKKGWEEEEYIFCASRENCPLAGRRFGNAEMEGSFGAGAVNGK